MEYFLEVSHLDAATADLLKKYDRDGNGSFSKDEVVAIILDLREAMQSNEMLGASNKMFKRMLIVAVTFCILLLTSIFGLSYAVAALTAKTDVTSDGVMTTIDGSKVVKTDSTAFTFQPEKIESGEFCLSSMDGSDIMSKVLSGSNVMMTLQGINGTRTRVERLSSSNIEMDEDGSVCFGDANGQQVCMTASPECTSTRRRLALSAENMTKCTDMHTLGANYFNYVTSFARTCLAESACAPIGGPWTPDECVCTCVLTTDLAVNFGTKR